MDRRLSKQVMVGQVPIGGGAPITVQSMLNVPAHDIAGNVAQALRLQACGCDIIRTAVPDKEDFGYFVYRSTDSGIAYKAACRCQVSL